MKITKKQLQEAVTEALEEGMGDIDRAAGVYTALVREAIEERTSHLQKKWPDLADGQLQSYLANVIGSHLFNHQKELPGQFNPKKKWMGYHEESNDPTVDEAYNTSGRGTANKVFQELASQMLSDDTDWITAVVPVQHRGGSYDKALDKAKMVAREAVLKVKEYAPEIFDGPVRIKASFGETSAEGLPLNIEFKSL